MRFDSRKISTDEHLLSGGQRGGDRGFSRGCDGVRRGFHGGPKGVSENGTIEVIRHSLNQFFQNLF